ncbi:hypothetical protein [Geobacillus sp. C56-T2]|uniref:hypothetical protein n=1 Tax=Geobacillus sp. C56-T2 TaxID=600773 RepID=UPI00119D324A|nr:hypothetical protein [Geobacillus sp. C56-T2]
MQNMTDSICFSIRETLQNQLSFLNENTADSCVTVVCHRPSKVAAARKQAFSGAQAERIWACCEMFEVKGCGQQQGTFCSMFASGNDGFFLSAAQR